MSPADKVVAARKYKGWSRAETVERLGITMEELRRLERIVFADKQSLWRGKVDYHLYKQTDDNAGA